MRVLLNPGHCIGLDPGAQNKELGLDEAVIVRAVADMVETYLLKSGYEVKVVQNNSLAAITRIANEWGADYFVSIHVNDFVNHNARGTETYCFEYGGKGERLATCIQCNILDKVGTLNRGVKEASYYVLRMTKMPAVLVELGFINNPDDVQKLIHKKQAFAEAIYKGIDDFVKDR